MKIGIIGCGLIGEKRANNINIDDIIISCCDIDDKKGKNFSKKYKCDYYSDYKIMLKESDIDIVIIAVVNKYAKNIIKYALKYDKHILVEKPMGKNYKDSKKILEYYNKYQHNSILKVGFNHRFHPAISDAKNYIDRIGDIMYIRGRYGHGGRKGMELEWRSSKDLCGGGELLDQGVHLIDLSRYFAGNISTVFGKINTKFWNINVEDNAFIHMTSNSNIDIQLHVSWTEWKNTFNFEIFGKDGYLKINGLNGSYGKETLEFALRNKEGGVPKITKLEYEHDVSWKHEWDSFKHSIVVTKKPNGDINDGLEANKIIKNIYNSSIKNKVIKL